MLLTVFGFSQSDCFRPSALGGRTGLLNLGRERGTDYATLQG